ncbi:lysylphosphatidylglycerol synthase transmembrane domain-containing protein [Bacteriovorax sp. DB6_IX]|uniref:lysylphosphatidylglycerol synthase transmembrane domain-containing protein n=1 Tax=Bacteriovorax sp. DB6_IX TaxID=1353530 RepID=UPI00038A17C3|nr:lysylphosphatidylglycerol synthase transmembrane domain-containing protein [Bacteriovorax sp. DB6_IX]EQC52472.1 membrane protein, PF03706 family [Bacteriovorax sp. DB6_IX]
MIAASFKIFFAVGILFWLVSSGKLDFKLMNDLLNSGSNLSWGLFFILLSITLTSLRWKFILEVKASRKLSFKKIFPINWIGLFFSTFLPGVVTGDVLKLLYVKDIDKKFSKTFLLTSVVMDRVFGLCGLLFLTGVISAYNYQSLIAKSADVKILLHTNFLLFAGSCFFITCLFLPKKLQEVVLNLIKFVPVLGEKVANTFEQVWLFGKNKKTTLTCLGLSIFTQFFNILGFWMLTSPFYGKEITLGQAYGFIPIGLLATAIPIAPAGAGVGHAVFDKLFALVGVSGGASLFNLYFLSMLMMNLLGVIPYLLIGKKHSVKEAESFEHSEATKEA